MLLVVEAAMPWGAAMETMPPMPGSPIGEVIVAARPPSAPLRGRPLAEGSHTWAVVAVLEVPKPPPANHWPPPLGSLEFFQKKALVISAG